MNSTAGSPINVQSAYYTLTRTVSAGAVSIVDLTGNYVHCLTSNLPSFLISLDGGPSGFMAAQVKVKAPFGSTFRNVIIDNTQNGAPLTVQLAIGLGDITDSRVPATVDPLDTAALAAQCFSADDSVVGVAAQFSMLSLWSALANTVTGRLRRVSVGPQVTDQFKMQYVTAPWTVGTVFSNKSPVGGAVPSVGPQPQIRPQHQTNVSNSVNILGGNSILRTLGATAGTFGTWEPKGPVLIPPGLGIAAIGQVVNNSVEVQWEWDEH